MTFEKTSRIIVEVDEPTKIWFADFCRRKRTTMSRMVRTMLELLKQETAVAENQEQENPTHEQ